jgi:membrane protease YdiL (CAAX protease family)
MSIKKVIHGFYLITSFPEQKIKGKGRWMILLKGLAISLIGIPLSLMFMFPILIICSMYGCPIKNIMASSSFNAGISAHIFLGLLLISVLVPLLEESIFRLWLSFKRIHIFISLFIVFYILIGLCIPSEKQIFLHGLAKVSYFTGYSYKLPLSILLSSSVFLVSQKNLDRIKEEYGHDLVVLSVIVFSALHITNMNFVWILLPAALLCCLPQLISGLVMTYYRINLGFFYGLVLHVLWNFVSII